jgi:hypothetical protein
VIITTVNQITDLRDEAFLRRTSAFRSNPVTERIKTATDSAVKKWREIYYTKKLNGTWPKNTKIFQNSWRKCNIDVIYNF